MNPLKRKLSVLATMLALASLPATGSVNEDDRAFLRQQESFSQLLKEHDNPALREMLSQKVRENPLSDSDARFIGDLKQKQRETESPRPAHGALYFVSFSIPKSGLVRMLSEADRYGVPATLRGMVSNDMRATADAVQALVKEGATSGVQIDPIPWRDYHIRSVPALVVYCEAGYDVVRGNLRIGEALRKVSELGQCRNEAQAILDKRAAS